MDMEEPLHLVPEEYWCKFEPSLRLDWPRSILVINLLETLRQFPELGRKFDFKIYCPYGDFTLGVIATCIKNTLREVIIQCNRDIKTFMEAVKGSKVINYELVSIQFTNRQVMEAMASSMRSINVEFCHLLTCDTLYVDRGLFEIQMPEDITFGLLSMEHVPQVNSNWEHRYPGSEWYFERLIESHLGYGLFKKETNELIAWACFTESGTFDNMHVLESYRLKGYGELLTKILYNSTYKNRRYVYTFCVKGNSVALSMYLKNGGQVIGETFWTIFMRKTQSKI